MSRKHWKMIPSRSQRAAARQEAARQNGALSHGPVTPEGKAISSQNALKHGVYSTKLVLPTESQEDFDRFREAYLMRLRPADLVELDLVEEIVSCRWRARRVSALETRALENGDTGARSVEQVLTTFRRLESSLARQADKAAKRLEQLRAERREHEDAQTNPDLDLELAATLEAICGNEPIVAQPEPNLATTPDHAPPLAATA